MTMKRIIHGKRYDTERSDLVASYSNTGDRRDHHHYTEGLYRTKAGLWFIAGEGGPRSRYRRTIGQNFWSNGQGLSALTEQEAREWLEEHEKTEALEKHFGVSIVDA